MYWLSVELIDLFFGNIKSPNYMNLLLFHQKKEKLFRFVTSTCNGGSLQTI